MKILLLTLNSGLGLQQPWSLHWFQGPYCSKTMSLPSVFQCLVQYWPPTFIYIGLQLAVPSVSQKIGQVFQLGTLESQLSSHLLCHHFPKSLCPYKHLIILIRHNTQDLSQCNNSTRKIYGSLQIGMEKIKLSILTGNINVYVENFKKSVEKLL